MRPLEADTRTRRTSESLVLPHKRFLAVLADSTYGWKIWHMENMVNCQQLRRRSSYLYGPEDSHLHVGLVS